jgi:hypothetical protein
MARGGGLKGSADDILRGGFGWSGTIGVDGRGVFDAGFAKTAGGAEGDEVESRKSKVDSKAPERNLRTRAAEGAARMRRTKVVGVVRPRARSQGARQKY